MELHLDIWKWAWKTTDHIIIKVAKHWAQAKCQGQTFKEGDKVWLEGCNLHINQPLAKLSPKNHGPFPIKKILSLVTYQLTLPMYIMENTQCVSCGPSYPIYWNGLPWCQLQTTPTWPYQRYWSIWSGMCTRLKTSCVMDAAQDSY